MIESTLKIEGMTCGHCVDTVSKTLKGVSGVTEASVSLEEKQARIRYDEGTTSLSGLKKAVEDAGFEVELSTFT